jgi:hypothetical protein
MSSVELKTAIAKLAGPGRHGEGTSLTPGCTFGVVVEQRLKDIDRDLGEVKGRLNGLIFLVVGAVVVDVVMRLVK